MTESYAADAAPDTSTYTWYYGEDLARTAPVLIRILEVSNWGGGNCDYEPEGDNTVEIDAFSAPSVVGRDNAAAYEGEGTFGVQSNDRTEITRFRAVEEDDLSADITWSSHLIAEL